MFAGFTLWLVAAKLEPRWATVVVFLAMLPGLLVATRVALPEAGRVKEWSRYGRVVLCDTLGRYLGWSGIAIWLNLTTALVVAGRLVPPVRRSNHTPEGCSCPRSDVRDRTQS